MKVHVVEGWTAPLDFQLFIDGVAEVLTGKTIGIVLTGQTSTIDTTGDFSVLDAATGKVRYSPKNAALVQTQSPIRMRWTVTDGTGKVAYFPNTEEPDFIEVHAP